MHSSESERQGTQRRYSAEFRNLARQAHFASRTNFWSQTVNFVTANSTSIHLLSLFVVFLIVQTTHVLNVNKLKADLATFLVENEVITRTDQEVDLLAFMEQYGKETKIQSQRSLKIAALRKLITY